MRGAINNQKELSQALKAEAQKEGFNLVGIATVPESSRIKLRNASLQRWLDAGHQANMNWMRSPKRKTINNLLKNVKSVISVGLNYYIDIKQSPDSLLIARYGWGKDYHKVIEKKLKKIGKWLEIKRPKCKWRVCVDSSPLLEKAWAEEAGIGWIGKHSNIINQNIGSWVFLGHLICTENLEPDIPAKSLCGECKKCIEACPTGAIQEPFVVNSNNCLAYHTIENRDEKIPTFIAKKMGPWIAGCDICQEVCPWNKKTLPNTEEPELQPKEWILDLTADKALSWSDETWKNKLSQSALKRIKPWMWRRNIKASNKTYT